MFKVKNSYFERIQWVDVGRGVGLLLVMLGHLVQVGSSTAIWIFSFHIPLFFFLSGYVSRLTENDGKYSMKKILINLIIPYFIFCLIGLIISLIIPAWRPSSVSKIIYEVFYNVNPESLHVGQIWFLFCLAIVEILFLIFLKLKIKNKYLIIGFIGMSALIAFSIKTYNIESLIFGDNIHLPWKINSAFMGFFFFSLGYYSKLLRLFPKIFSKSTLKNIIFALVLFITNLYVGIGLNGPVNLSTNSYGNLVYFIVASVSGILFIIFISKFIESDAILKYMGKNSLSIFSSHSLFIYLYAFLISNLLGESFFIMVNIPLPLSLTGLLLVGLMSLVIPFIYNNTIQKLLLKIKNNML